MYQIILYMVRYLQKFMTPAVVITYISREGLVSNLITTIFPVPCILCQVILSSKTQPQYNFDFCRRHSFKVLGKFQKYDELFFNDVLL